MLKPAAPVRPWESRHEPAVEERRRRRLEAILSAQPSHRPERSRSSSPLGWMVHSPPPPAR